MTVKSIWITCKACNSEEYCFEGSYIEACQLCGACIIKALREYPYVRRQKLRRLLEKWQPK